MDESSTLRVVPQPVAGRLVSQIASLYGLPPVDPADLEFKDHTLVNVAVR